MNEVKSINKGLCCRSGKRAVRPLIYPYWGPEFNSRCRQGDNCGGQCLIFWSFSRGFPSSPFWFHQHSPPLHVISYSHSFVSCHPSLYSWLWKIVELAQRQCIIISVGGMKWGAHHVLFHWTLSLSGYYLGQDVSEWLITILPHRAQSISLLTK